MMAIFEFFSTEFVLWHYVFASSQHIRRHFSESSVLNSETKPILSRLTFIRAPQTSYNRISTRSEQTGDIDVGDRMVLLMTFLSKTAANAAVILDCEC